MDELWSADDKAGIHLHQNAQTPSRPCPTTAPSRFIRPQPMLVTPGFWSGNKDGILEVEFQIIQQRCVSMVSEILHEARCRISSRLHDLPAAPVAGNGQFANDLPPAPVVGNPGLCAKNVDDPSGPILISTLPVMDGFNPQALGGLVGGNDTSFNTNCVGRSCSDLFKESQQDWRSELSGSHDPATASTTSASVAVRKAVGPVTAGVDLKKRQSRHIAHAISDGEPDILSAIHFDGELGETIRTFNISFEGGVQASIQRLLSSSKWDIFIASVIITNAMFMGYQIDWATTHVNEPMPFAQYFIGYAYTFIFTIELIFRMIGEQCHFFSFKNKMTHWNYLDCFVVLTSLAEIYFDYQLLAAQDQESAGGGAGLDAGQVRIVGIIRISRLMKIFRIARLLHFIRALRTLVFSILCTLKSVFWALLLMLLFIYVFAMILTQAVGGYKETNDCADALDLCEHWGNLSVSMLSLFKAIAGGISWHEILVPLQKNLEFMWVIVFLVYVVFLYFAVLNVITGVFCESAIQSSKADQEMVIHEALQSKKNYKQKLERLFREIDEDGSNEISLNELEQYMTSEMSGAFFEYLELEVNNARDIIKLIDVDGSGELSLDEFIEGVWRLRGPARALNIAEVVYDNKAFQHWVYKALLDMSNVLAHHYRVELTGQTAPPTPIHKIGESHTLAQHFHAEVNGHTLPPVEPVGHVIPAERVPAVEHVGDI